MQRLKQTKSRTIKPLQKKTKLFKKDRISEIEEHFQVKLNDRNFHLGRITIEPIFIVNTPTFMMYNNPFRIYTLKDFEYLIQGKFVDKIYKIPIDEGKPDTVDIKYPYFKKPGYKVFDGRNGLIFVPELLTSL